LPSAVGYAKLLRMARDMDVGTADGIGGESPIGRLRRRLVAGGRMQDDWFEERASRSSPPRWPA